VTEARRRDTIAVSILALLPAALFFDVLTGLRCLYLRDLSNFHYPAKKILREIVLRGDFPFWNPFFGAGQPLAANPQHEVFYPLTWLILLPDFTTGFHLLILAHISIALVAMYALLRSMSLGLPAAILGALSFGLGGLALSTLNLLPFLFSMAWIPLTCLYTRRFLRQGARRDFALAALFLAIQLLVGEPATALQTGTLLGIYALSRSQKRGRGLAAVALISAAAVVVAAVQVLPAIDHLHDSVRARQFDLASVATWSMPLLRIAEVVNPDLLGDPVADQPEAWHGASLYAGRIVPFYFSVYVGLLLAIAAAAGFATRARGAGLALTILVLSFLLAAGDHTPLLRLLYAIGIGGYLRYPEKFFLMAGFTLIVFGARMLQSLLDGDERLRKVMIGLGAMALLVPGSNALLALIRVGVLTVLMVFLRRIPRTLTPVLLGAFLLFDLAPLFMRLTPRMPSRYYREAPPADRQFPRDRDSFRIFHLGAWYPSPDAQDYFEPRPGRYWAYRNALVPMTPAAHDLRMVLNTDYDASALLPTHEFTLAASTLARRHTPGWVDSVAAMSNVRYAVMFRPFHKAVAEAKGDFRSIEPVRVIRGPLYPRYYFATQVVPFRDRQDFVDKLASGTYDKTAAFVESHPGTTPPVQRPAPGIVRRWSERSNQAQIEVDATGAAFLVMSVTSHKYWRMTIDGRQAGAIVTNIGYQGVIVPPGHHLVEMRYRNPLIAAGAAVSMAGLLALILALRRA
jgi:hypothetical protein